MDNSHLRKWKILNHLTDDELGNIAYLHIYGSPHKDLSALFITHDDQVYGTGRNCLIGSDKMALNNDTSIRICCAQQVNVDLVKCIKVEALSGLGITKIVVGSTFGAAMTNKGAVYVWGSVGEFTTVKVNDWDVLMYEEYAGNSRCIRCRNSGSSFLSSSRQEVIGSITLIECGLCHKFPVYTASSPPPYGAQIRRFLKFSKPVGCLKCRKPTSSKQVGSHDLQFCEKCNELLELTNDTHILSKVSSNFKAPEKLKFGEFWKICDIYNGGTFLVIEVLSGSLLLWGLIGDVHYKTYVSNPDNIRSKSVSCGESHLAVISSRGELYTCGLGNKGQLGYPWTADKGHMTLRKVPLKGSVVKVCCGYSSTTCLMSNGSIMSFGSNILELSSGVVSLSCQDSDYVNYPVTLMNSTKFTDIVSSPSTNIFCAKTEDQSVLVWGYSLSLLPEVLFEVSELSEALQNLPYTYTASQYSDPAKQLSLGVSLEHGDLFGNKLFSDLTLKLADGDFPVHRLILHSKSSYFKDIFSNEEPCPDVLDMSSYNPTSYKCLLKYFYHLPSEDLNSEDLFDLYSIASSYKEKDLVESTFRMLKAMINPDTVLKIHAKATSTNDEELLQECELFLNSPEFKNDLISFVSQDMKNAIAILRMKSGE